MKINGCRQLLLLLFLISGWHIYGQVIDKKLPVPLYSIDFDKGEGIAAIGKDRWVRFDLDKILLRDNNQGKGLFCQPDCINYLPKNIANPTKDILDSLKTEDATVTLDSTNVVKKPFGFSIDLKSGDSFIQFPPITIKRPKQSMDKSKSYLFSFYAKSLKDSQDIKVLLNASQAFKDKKDRKRVKIQEINIIPRWKRYAVILDLEKESITDTISVALTAGKSEGARFCMDCLQLEACQNYPQYQQCPTEWIPGESRRKTTFPFLPVGTLPFPSKTGTICFTTRLVNDCPEMDPGELTWLVVGNGWKRGIEISSGFSIFNNTRIPTGRKLKKILRDGFPHQIALVWDSKKAGILIDGNKVGEAKIRLPRKGQIQPDKSKFRLIMGQHSPHKRTAHGFLDDICIFDVPLTRTQLLKLKIQQDKRK